MKSPEEEADSELGQRLRKKFDGYKVPGDDRTRDSIFAALDKPSDRLHWVPRAGGLLLMAALALFFLIEIPTGISTKEPAVLHINKIEKVSPTQTKLNSTTERDRVSTYNLQQKYTSTYSKNNVNKLENIRTIRKQEGKIGGKRKFSNKFLLPQERFLSSPSSKAVSPVGVEKPVSDQVTVAPSHDLSTNTADHAAELALLSPIDSVLTSVSLRPSIVAPVLSNILKGTAKKPAVVDGVKGVFSASLMETFQLVSLRPSAEDRIQNFRFAPLLSSKVLAYKLTAGIEKKHTQLLLNYTYLRSWNEYEVGTDKVLATRVGENQYHMTILGENHLEDERLHLLGIGIRQRLVMPQHMLKHYSLDLGIDYTRLMGQGQNLVWGTIGFYRNLYRFDGTRFAVGPYLQYSFTERESAAKMWRSRAYQVGISVGVKMK